MFVGRKMFILTARMCLIFADKQYGFPAKLTPYYRHDRRTWCGTTIMHLRTNPGLQMKSRTE